MVCINIELPDELGKKAEREASLRGQSLEEFVRTCVTKEVALPKPRSIYDEVEVFDRPTPPDLSARHDDYLCEDYQ